MQTDQFWIHSDQNPEDVLNVAMLVVGCCIMQQQQQQ
jgi:hypothetical protein